MSDIISEDLPDWHIECKGTTEAIVGKAKLRGWYEQICRDAHANQHQVILHKANGKELVAILPLASWEAIRPTTTDIPCYFGTCVEDSVSPSAELKRLKDTVKLLYLAERTQFIRLVGLFYGLEIAKEGLILIMLDAVDWLHCIRKFKTVQDT